MTNGDDTVYKLRNVCHRRTHARQSFEITIDKLDIRAGDRIAIVGESGCGKSTLLDILALILSPLTADTFTFSPSPRRSHDILRLWGGSALDRLGRLRGNTLGYVLQTGGLLPFISVRENIRLPGRMFGVDDLDYVDFLAGRLGVQDHLGKLPKNLSVGERQRVAIARALAHRPPVILADEPTASVDPANSHSIMELLMELVSELGVTVIVASHDPQQIDRYDLSALRLKVEKVDNRTIATFGN
jgi:putative ABC transport system ATP-binding protein